MSSVHLRRVILGFVCVLLSSILSWFMRDMGGWTPDFVLATLLVYALYGSMPEVLLLSGFVAWISNWTDTLRIETILIILLPLAVFGLRKSVLPFKNIFSAFFLTVFGVVIFYVIAVGLTVFSYLGMLASIAALSGFWGVLVYTLFYSAKTKE